VLNEHRSDLFRPAPVLVAHPSSGLLLNALLIERQQILKLPTERFSPAPKLAAVEARPFPWGSAPQS
jgi:hypothetical protein